VIRPGVEEMVAELAFPDDDRRAEVGALLVDLAGFMDAAGRGTPSAAAARSDEAMLEQGVVYLLEDANEPANFLIDLRGRRLIRQLVLSLEWHRGGAVGEPPAPPVMPAGRRRVSPSSWGTDGG
jgi:hypothetical protein